MSATKIGTADFACVAKRGIATMPGVGVIYPTPDGLAAVSANGARNVTESLLTRADWQRYVPESLVSEVNEGRYYGFYDNGDKKGCVLLKNDILSELDLHTTAAYRDGITDTLYVVQDGRIVAWDASDDEFAPYVWHSRVFELPRPMVLTAARVFAQRYGDCTLHVYGDDREIASVKPRNDDAFRLPATNRYRRCELAVTGTDRVKGVEVADSVKELL